MKIKFDWFILGMAAAVGLAWLAPHAGAPGGWLRPELVNKIGVALIFFFTGLSLAFAAMKAGAMRWPVHVMVQATTFGVFPLAGWAMMAAPAGWIAPELAIGFFYLCAAPSTVSSSVVMTAAARGNVPVAVFNATLSSVIGIFLTPTLIGWMLKTGEGGMRLGPVIMDLVLWLLLPLALGQAARPWLKDWAYRNKTLINRVDRGTILFIIYTSFCESILHGVWSGKSEAVATAAVGSLVLFTLVFYLTSTVAKAAAFNEGDRIAAIFCGSKKSIAAGVPMAQLIFAGDPRLGMILLPLMLYHPLQLVICGVLARRWGQRPGGDT